MKLPFVGPSYDLESRPSGVARTVNMFPIPVEPGNERSAWVLKDAPGLEAWSLDPALVPDPFWADVILHLNADTSLLLDNSPLANVITSTGAPTQNTSTFLYGSGSIDTTSGRLESLACPTFPGLLGANEFTLRWWIRPTALPVNVSESGFYFADFLFNGIGADGSFDVQGIIQTSGGAAPYGVGAPPGTLIVDEWNWICFTRTNEAGLGHFELFHGTESGGTATKIGDSTAFNETWPQANSTMVTDRLVGYDANPGIPIYTNAQWDDFQLTRNVNRYRDLTTTPLPGLLPIFGP